jgi:hypothetical protein
VWQGQALEPVQLLHNGPAWITGCCWVGGAPVARLAVAALDRTVGGACLSLRRRHRHTAWLDHHRLPGEGRVHEATACPVKLHCYKS